MAKVMGCYFPDEVPVKENQSWMDVRAVKANFVQELLQ